MIGPHNHIFNYTRCAGAVIPALSRPRVFAPLAALALVELVLVAIYLGFMTPGLSVLAVPVVGTLFGGESLHYPEHIFKLPAVLDWIRFVAAIGAGAFCYRAVVRRLLEHVGSPDSTLHPTNDGTVSLVAAIGAYALLELLVQRGVGLLADVRIVGRLQPVWILLALVVRSAFAIAMAHAVYGIAVPGRRGWGAFRSGAVVTLRTLPFTLLIALTATVVAGPIDLLVDQAAWFVDLGRPELVKVLCTLAILIDIPVRLWLFGSAVWLRATRGVTR
jgi:hypothetical protein